MNNNGAAHYRSNSAHGDDDYLSRKVASFCLLLPRYFVIDAVFDGLSLGRGYVASGVAKRKLATRSISSVDDVVRLLGEANSELFRFGVLTGCLSLTTATIALMQGSNLYVVNVGDSPAYLVRQGKAHSQITPDKVTMDFVAAAVGLAPSLNPHIYSTRIEPGDRLVLLTDGVSDNVASEEIADIVSRELSPQPAIDALKKLLLDKKRRGEGFRDGRFKDDDATVIIRYFS